MATPPVKKNNNSLYIKGCLGCFGIVVLFVLFIGAIGGYLFYLEETGLDDHSDEILIVKVVDGLPTTLNIQATGRTRARFNIWVRGSGLTDAAGKITCNKSPRTFGIRKHYRSKTDGPHKHIWLRSLRMSSRSKPKPCVVAFTTLKGKGPFEIVVTKSQRPSDWF